MLISKFAPHIRLFPNASRPLLKLSDSHIFSPHCPHLHSIASQASSNYTFLNQSTNLRFLHRDAFPAPVHPAPSGTDGASESEPQDVFNKISFLRNSSPSLLLEYVEKVDVKKLNYGSIGLTASLLHQMVANERSDVVRKQVLTSKGMEQLFKAIKIHSRTLDSRILVTICKLFKELELPSNDLTFQIILRLLSQHANTMEIPQLIYLNFLLEQILLKSTSPLVEALKMALPRVFENQLHFQAVNCSIQELCTYFQFAVKSDCSERCIIDIARMIYKKQDCITPSHAFRVLCCLADSNICHLKETRDLLRYVFGILSCSIETVEVPYLEVMLRKCAKQVRLGQKLFYDQDFLDAVVKRLIDIQDEELILNAVNPLSTMRHVSIDFLESCADIIAAHPTLILHDEMLFFSILRAFCNANYKPRKWESLKALFLKHPAVNTVHDSRLVTMTLDFMVLDILPVCLLERLFSPESDHVLEAWLTKNGPYTLTIIFNAVKRLYVSYEGPLPSAPVMDGWRKSIDNETIFREYPLKSTLHSAFGGESGVVTGLVQDGIHIEHCVITNEEGIALAFSEGQPQRLDSVAVPDSYTLSLIRVIGPRSGNNMSRLEGIKILERRILETYGHPVIDIDAAAWQELMESEKISYILCKLDTKRDKEF